MKVFSGIQLQRMRIILSCVIFLITVSNTATLAGCQQSVTEPVLASPTACCSATPHNATGEPMVSAIVSPDSDCAQGHIDVDDSAYEIPNQVRPPLLSEQDGWVRNERNCVSGFYSMYQPEVIRVNDTEYPYRMWFMGWAYNTNNDLEILGDGTVYEGYPGGDAIFLARSKDLDEWQVYSRSNNGSGAIYWDRAETVRDWVPVLTCQDVWYDDFHVGDPSIVYQNGTYFMAYSAMGTDKPDDEYAYAWQDAAYCIMGAVSSDGINWVRSQEPLLIWEGEYGADENIQRSADNDTYYGMYQRPSLMYEDGKWKMWFDYWAGYRSGNGTSVGYAENDGDFLDSTAWDRKTGDTTPLLRQFVDLDVVRIGRVYYGYGDPFLGAHRIADPEIKRESPEWSMRQIVEVQSYDGIEWSVTGYFRPDEGYPANQVPQVFIDHDGQRILLFYATQRGRRESSVYDWRWDTLRYMYRPLSAYGNLIGTVSPVPPSSSQSPPTPTISNPLPTATPDPSQAVTLTEAAVSPTSIGEPSATTGAMATPTESISGNPTEPVRPARNQGLLVMLIAVSVMGTVLAAMYLLRRNRTN